MSRSAGKVPGVGALGALALLFVGGAAAPASAQEPTVAVEAVCVTTHGDSPVARFDVFPHTLEEHVIPVGVDNAFSPGPTDRGQPTVFGPAPGSVAIPFDPAHDPPLTWHLGGDEATATDALPTCEIDLLPDGIPLLDDVLPDELRRSILDRYVALGRLSEPFARGPRGAEGPIGETGPGGPPGPTGPPGDAGVVIVRERINTPGTQAASATSLPGALTATCPEATVAVAGGADPSHGSSEIVGSAATADAGGWAVVLAGALQGSVDIYAVCLTAASATVQPPGPGLPDPDDPDSDAGSDDEGTGPDDDGQTDTEDPDDTDAVGDGGSGSQASAGASDAATERQGTLARTGRNLLLLAAIGAGCAVIGTTIRRRTSLGS